MYRTFVILRHTFLETVVQPIYTLLIVIGIGILAIFGMLPFFTLGEDTVMFKSVALDVILLLVLIATLFATSKSIFEEIEDRTMLTLMSKPVRRWEVLIGKYLGIILAALLAIAILAIILVLCVWWRIPGDYQMSTNALDERDVAQLFQTRWMHVMGLIPSLVLMWLQISVLAAIGVALSTRFSLVVNLPVVILLYIAGNLTRFLFPLDQGPLQDRPIAKVFAYIGSILLPYLGTFDDRQRTVYGKISIAGMEFLQLQGAVPLSKLWAYTGTATLYALAYATFALAVGMLLFQTRELGGAEG
ncbi:MAG TPA: ABC transporter permease subunit [Tepidisphaeraceae bacterium]|nr:ABC transporter permease subunit [Tepidisphaeraceae bacterium]